MGIKEILKESFKEGVNQFFNSALDQIEEQNKQYIGENLAEYERTLEEVQCTLDLIGANGKFDKEFKGKEDIWDFAMIMAIVLSGQGTEGTGFEEFEGFFDKSLEDLSLQWVEVKAFVEYISISGVGKDIYPFSADIDLTEECNNFYEDILQLKDWGGGLFSTRKFKKEIMRCSERLSAVCTAYIIGIEVLHKMEYL